MAPRKTKSAAIAVHPRAPLGPPPMPPELAAWNAHWGILTTAPPLRITAELVGRVALPGGPMAIDSLLALLVARRACLPPLMRCEEALAIDVPIAKHAAGFHLASFSCGAFEKWGVKWINRRFPIEQAQSLGSTAIRKVLLSAGPCKSYRIPLAAGHVRDDLLTWYALGDAEAIRDLLSDCRYLGKRRAIGLGRVVRWTVEPCEPWGPGFPVVSPDGTPLRTLPDGWPGVRADAERGFRTLTYPYHDKTREELCYAPGWAT